MDETHGTQSTLWWNLTLVAWVLAVIVVTAWTPTEATMGPVQKIFYLHLPVAINTFLACLTVFVAGIGFLYQRDQAWDDLAHAAGKLAVLLCTIVLLTGMFWGKSAWGQWWTWSPRLTFSLVLWLLYAVYLVLRLSIEEPYRRAVICAAYGIIAFLDVPLVYMSVRLMPDIHPSSVALAPAMKATLVLWFVPVTMLHAGLLWSTYRLHRRQAAMNRQPAAPPRRVPTTHWMKGGLT